MRFREVREVERLWPVGEGPSTGGGAGGLGGGEKEEEGGWGGWMGGGGEGLGSIRVLWLVC